MGIDTALVIIALLIGFYMAWNIGANDVANAIGTSVGSGALTLKRAVLIAAVLEFAGALLVGSHVSETVQKGIVRLDLFADTPYDVVYGMIAALLAAGAWLQIASYFGWPVSTTHSIVGAVIGYGIILGGLDAIYWDKVSQIVASWLVSPLLGASISYVSFSILRKYIFYSWAPTRAAKRMAPVIVFVVISLFCAVGLVKGLANLHLDLAPPVAVALCLLLGFCASVVSYFLVRPIPDEPCSENGVEIRDPQVFYSIAKLRKHLGRIHSLSKGEIQSEANRLQREIEELEEKARKVTHTETSHTDFSNVERIFAGLQIVSACFMAFSHGANDVANAIGPLSGALSILSTGSVETSGAVPVWILALGGAGIVLGLATWGWRVIETIGKKITELTPSRGFAAEFGAATTILLATKLGLPISTTHTLVGAVLGVGLARGLGAINLALIRDIILSWLITLPAGTGMAVVFFFALKAVFG